MMKYEKPRMEFSALQNETAVAAPCWPGSKSGVSILYYNTPGDGYVRLYFTNDGDGVVCSKTRNYEITYISVPAEAQAAADAAVAAAVSNIAPKPFKGYYENFSETPVHAWS